MDLARRTNWLRCLGAALLIGLAFGTASNRAGSDPNEGSYNYASAMDTPLDRNDVVTPYDGRITALETFKSIDLTKDDMVEILPLLKDMCYSERVMWADSAVVEYDLASRSYHHQPKMEPSARVEESKKRCAEKCDKLWAKMSKRIGDTKTTAIRNLVEPQRHEITNTEYSEGIRRIEVLLAQWDQETKERLARNGTPQTETVVAAEVRITTPVMTTITPVVYYTSPVLSKDDLVDVLQERLVHMVGSPGGDRMIMYYNRDLTASDLYNLHHMKMHTWE